VAISKRKEWASPELGSRPEELRLWELAHAETNDEDVARLKRALAVAIQEELTDRQSQLLQMYFFEGKTTVKIAKELGINRSTASRIINRALRRLEKVLKYSLM